MRAGRLGNVNLHGEKDQGLSVALYARESAGWRTCQPMPVFLILHLEWQGMKKNRPKIAQKSPNETRPYAQDGHILR